jgi:hypothetical protein
MVEKNTWGNLVHSSTKRKNKKEMIFFFYYNLLMFILAKFVIECSWFLLFKFKRFGLKLLNNSKHQKKKAHETHVFVWKNLKYN